MRVAFTSRAQDRLAEIDANLSERDPQRAAKTIEKLIERCESLNVFPRRGRKVPEIDDDAIRELIEGTYRVVYRIRSEALLEVVTIFDARQEFPHADVLDGE